MKVRINYFTVDGEDILEKTRIRKRNIEMLDGPHPVTNDCVWQDARRRQLPQMFITEGVFPPYGASMAWEDSKTRLYEIDVAARSFKAPSVSKMWVRALARLWEFIWTKGAIILVALFIIYQVAKSMWGG